MFKKLYYVVIGILIGALLFSTFAIANSPIKLIINNKEIQCDMPPQNINGRVLVPIRTIGESLDCTVEWDTNNNAVVVNSVKTQSQSTSAINTPAQTSAGNEAGIKETTFKGMKAIVKDGVTYFLSSNYFDKTRNSSKVKTNVNSQTKEITINDSTITQSSGGWIIYKNLTYINSEYYIAP